MSLSAVGKLVAQHSATPVEIQKKLQQREREAKIVRCMVNWIIRGMIVLGIGVVILVCAKNFDLGKWVRTIATLVILSGCGSALFGVLNSLRQGASLSTNSEQIPLDEPVDTKQLPANPIPSSLPSVTERTTQLISVKTSDSESKFSNG
ncbi:MAG: hypothetical protein C5B55_13390 [Blastocatellia bacterium]|nr:MAG: hypothetical protein C5B55_13390 [Blastocatellia bacterium]